MNLRIVCLLLFSVLLIPPLPAGDHVPPRLMLATVYEAGVDVSDYWISEKLDGVRGRWDGNTLRTRGGHLINAPGWFTDWPTVPMDGELWIDRGGFGKVSGIVRAVNPATTPGVRYASWCLTCPRMRYFRGARHAHAELAE